MMNKSMRGTIWALGLFAALNAGPVIAYFVNNGIWHI